MLSACIEEPVINIAARADREIAAEDQSVPARPTEPDARGAPLTPPMLPIAFTEASTLKLLFKDAWSSQDAEIEHETRERVVLQNMIPRQEENAHSEAHIGISPPARENTFFSTVPLS